MTKEKMTVHQALAELKVLDSRIIKAIDEGHYVTANKHTNEKIDGKPIANFKENAVAAYRKSIDLINRRNAIKRAVIMSNANTMVTVNGVEYTVAEAIDMKNNGMEMKDALLRKLVSQNRIANNIINSHAGEAIEQAAEKYVISIISSQPKDSKMSIESEAMQGIRKAYIENNTYDKIDPLGVDALMEKMENEINSFKTNIDAALSVSNAITTIEIEYENGAD